MACCGDYIVEVENILNPFPGILEAFAKLTSLVVRKGLRCDLMLGPRVFGSSLFQTCI